MNAYDDYDKAENEVLAVLGSLSQAQKDAVVAYARLGPSHDINAFANQFERRVVLRDRDQEIEDLIAVIDEANLSREARLRLMRTLLGDEGAT